MNNTDSIFSFLHSDSLEQVTNVVNSVSRDTIIFIVQQSATEAVNTEPVLISGWLFFLILGTGIGLYFLSTFIKKYIVPFFKTKYKMSKIDILWFRITTILWTAFILISIYALLKASLLISIIFFLIILLVGHQFLIDSFIGLFYKFEHQIRLKDNLSIGDLSGEITAFHIRHMQIVNAKNEDILIPYRKLLNTSILITKQVDNLKRKTITILLDGQVSGNISRLQNDMSRCPWIYNSKHYSIEHADGNNYSVHLMAKDTFTFNKVEAYLNSKVQE